MQKPISKTAITPRDSDSPIDRFLSHLSGRAADRGIMADLRHGFNPGTQYRAWPHIAPWCDLTNDRDRTIWLTVAAGFATQKGSQRAGSLGATMRQIAMGDGPGRDGLKTFDARFRRLLSCSSAQELCQLLPGILRTAARKGVPVDYSKLYRDLCFWPHSKLRWARDYWSGASKEGGEK